MKGNGRGRGGGGGGPPKGNTQFELKQRVVLALTKLSDRDTCQIGVDELEKIAQSLTPDGITSFLSCLLDTDKEQKSSVRRECVRLMGVLAMYHGAGLVVPHLGKMVASIVKRIRDPDSVVRDACVETVGVLASKLSDPRNRSDGVFVVLVRPLFEALGEQNKQMQFGSALCLARVIDSIHDPPVSIMQRMLARTIKLLKNPHFMAKPAVMELNRSIIQAGGAPSQSLLVAAMTNIQDALKDSDWTTRKAACVALGEVASTGGLYLAPFKASCIRSLESCRFDKVKPVRDAVLHALQYWKSLPCSDRPELSETGSSIKENFCAGDYSDVNSMSDSGRKDVSSKVTKSSIKGRIPLSVKKPGQCYIEPQDSKSDEWHVEIAVPKSRNVHLADFDNDESEGSSITKTLERMSGDMSLPYTGCEYLPMDDKQECSSVSNLAADNFETKFVTIFHDPAEKSCLLKPMVGSQRLVVGEANDKQIYDGKMHDRRSLDSTVTVTSSQTLQGCCSQAVTEMACIRERLVEIESKQSNLLEMLQVFSTSIMDSLSTLQSKVSGLEHEVDGIFQVLAHGGRHSESLTPKYLKQSQCVSSPRLSMCTPRPSVDIRNRPLLSSAKNSDIWDEDKFGSRRTINYSRPGMEMRMNSVIKQRRNAIETGMQKSFTHRGQSVDETRKMNASSASVYGGHPKQDASETRNLLWQRVKGFLCKRDLDSAYAEALCAGDEFVLMNLLDRTGPVLESFSHKTVAEILSIFVSYFLEQRYTSSIIPWFQQVVELSTMHGADYLLPSAKARREFCSAIQDVASLEFSNPADKRSVTQLAVQLRQLWG